MMAALAADIISALEKGSQWKREESRERACFFLLEQWFSTEGDFAPPPGEFCLSHLVVGEGDGGTIDI